MVYLILVVLLTYFVGLFELHFFKVIQMRSFCVALVLCCLLAFVGSTAFSGNTQNENVSMFSRLKVGQRVRLEKAVSGGFVFFLLNDEQVKSFQKSNEKFVAPKIVEIGQDFVVVDQDDSYELTISFDAIHVIANLRNAKNVAAENDASKD